MSQVTGIKRTYSLDISKLRPSKRQKTIPPAELHHKTMTGVVPVMSFAYVASVPDIRVVNKLRDIIETGLRSQKRIAIENDLSQTTMSQFMNGATRVKGWPTTNSILDSWADKFNAKIKEQTDLLEKQKDAESTKCKCSIALYTQPSVIELSNKSNFEDYRWETATSMEAFRCEEDNNISVPWFSDNHSCFINSTDAENMHSNSRASSDWANFDIQQMF